MKLKKILLINPFGIGDVLFTTPIIHCLKDQIPQVKIGYLCNRRTQGVLKNNPYLDKIFVYERDEFESLRKKSFIAWLRKFKDFLNQIRKERFDLVLDFSMNTQYGFFSWLAGIKNRVGYDFKKRGRFLTKRFKFDGFIDKHVIEYYTDLLTHLGVKIKYKKPELFLDHLDIEQVEVLLKSEGLDFSKPLVAIIPGAGGSWGKDAYIKHWPAEKFARLADKIIENFNATIIIVGDFSERKIARQIKELANGPLLDLVGRTTLGELAALFKKTKLVVTNDGGPLHMAVALGIKTVSIFGPVDEKIYGPYPEEKQNLLIHSNIECRPCYRLFRMPACPRQRQCLVSISVEEVFSAVRRLW